MSFFAQPAVNLHSPTAIGDVTPNTGAFSGNLSVGNLIAVGGTWGFYDFRVQLPSNGEISFTAGSLNAALSKTAKILQPSAKTIEVTAGDLTNTDTGVVLASPDGTRYRVTVSNLGVVTTAAA